MFEPVFTPSGKTITFSDAFGLFDMSATGKRLRLLVGSEGILGKFTYAPDGKSMVGTDLTAGFLFDMTADGSEVTRLPGTAHLFDPSYSPDGRHIIASRPTGSHGARLVSLRPSGGVVRPVRHSAGDHSAVYTPDGRHILFERELRHSVNWRYRAALYEMRPNGSHVHRVGDTVSHCRLKPTFSPDGRFIAFDMQRTRAAEPAIWIMRSDGSGARQVTDAGRHVASENPSWQPLPSH